MTPLRFHHALTALLIACSTCAQGAPPKVVGSSVEDGQDDVDPALTEIRIEFDQPMAAGSWSIVGGGPAFPEVTGKPRWANERTIVVGVKLQPEHEYWMSVNSDTFKGFRGRGGGAEAAWPQPLAFHTRASGAAAEPANPLTPEQNRAAIAALRKAIDSDYAYRDRLKIDWEKAIAAQAATMQGAKTPNQFARAAAKVLRAAEDGHVYVRAGERAIYTRPNATPPNFNGQTLARVVPEWKEYEGGVATGTFEGGLGYLMIPEWSPRVMKGLDEAFAAMKGSKGLIVDVRPNGGGDETLAKRFATRFVDGPKVYSKNRNRRDGTWLGPYERVIEPAAAGADRYTGPVAVLIGPKVGSACESFVLMMRQGPRCKLVGDVTKGSSGNPKPHELGNGVTVFLSSWEDQTPDGTAVEGRGVSPDLAVKGVDFRQRDAVIEAALGAVRTRE